MARGAAVAIAASVLAVGGVFAGLFAARRTILDFANPLPANAVASSSAGPAALPTEKVLMGGESRELGKLANMRDGGPDPRAAHVLVLPAPVRIDAGPADRFPALRRPEIAQREDPRIDATIRYWLHDDRTRATLVAAYQRSGRYAPTTDRILRAWKVPEELSAIALLESGFVPSAVRADGASGLWGFPLDVAATYGLMVTPSYDERRGIETSTEVAGRYLADLKERLGSWQLAIYAFARGYRHTVEDLTSARSLDFYDLLDVLRPEEATYVIDVLALVTIMANPERFTLDSVHIDAPLATSDMEVPALAPLATIAQAAGTSLGRLRELNPEYLGDVVPSTGGAMVVHLPNEGLARAKELLTPLLYAPQGRLGAEIGWNAEPGHGPHDKGKHEGSGRGGGKSGKGAPALPGDTTFYRVREGDTLESLAGRLGVAREAIASDNALDPNAALTPGQLLRIRSAEPQGAGPR